MFSQMNIETVQFQTIHFSLSMQFNSIWLIQMLPLRARVDLGAMTIKEYPALPKASALLEPHHQIVLVSYPGHLLVGYYPSAEKLLEYYTAPADRELQKEGRPTSLQYWIKLARKLTSVLETWRNLQSLN